MSEERADRPDLEAVHNWVVADELSRAAFFRRAATVGLGVALSGSIALGAAGCGDEDTDSASEGGKADSTNAGQPIEVKTVPKTPYKDGLPAGAKPNLPKRIAMSLPATGEVFVNFAKATKAAAEARGLEYIEAQANGDSTKQIQQVQGFLSRGIGALVAFDVAPPALEAIQRQTIQKGIPVFTGPYKVCTTQANVDQYDIGNQAGESAVRWIKQSLGGNAQVVIFNGDKVPSTRPRTKGILDALRAGGPGIRVIENIGAHLDSAETGFQIANTVMQRRPNVDVWIAGDSLLGGVLSALKAKGKAEGNIGLFGTDGDAKALSEIAKGGIYRSTQGAQLSILGYAYGNFAADWLEGKSIPQLMVFNTSDIDSPEKVHAFNAINQNPAAAFETNRKTQEHFIPYGNTSYEDNRWLSVV